MMKTANYIYWPAQLGHRELSMTQRYAHLSPDHMRAVADLTLKACSYVSRSDLGKGPALKAQGAGCIVWCHAYKLQ